MPVCKAMGNGIYAARTNLIPNRIAGVLLYTGKKGRVVLLLPLVCCFFPLTVAGCKRSDKERLAAVGQKIVEKTQMLTGGVEDNLPNGLP